jgi:hypothetical protein
LYKAQQSDSKVLHSTIPRLNGDLELRCACRRVSLAILIS